LNIKTKPCADEWHSIKTRIKKMVARISPKSAPYCNEFGTIRQVFFGAPASAGIEFADFSLVLPHPGV
jgi:hypothetical protein